MKKLVIAITGGTLLALGIAVIVLPGPAVVVIPAALAVLATEFLWARRALQRCRTVLQSVRQKPPGMPGDGESLPGARRFAPARSSAILRRQR